MYTGKFPRCAPVRYSKVYEQLPAGLRGKHREEAYGEEWTTLREYIVQIEILVVCVAVQSCEHNPKCIEQQTNNDCVANEVPAKLIDHEQISQRKRRWFNQIH